jgi:hypothetical protein
MNTNFKKCTRKKEAAKKKKWVKTDRFKEKRLRG